MKTSRPETSRPSYFTIQLDGRLGLQAADYARQRYLAQLQQKMYVVWHDHPTKDRCVSNARRMLNIPAHNPGKFRLLEPRNALISNAGYEINTIFLRPATLP